MRGVGSGSERWTGCLPIRTGFLNMRLAYHVPHMLSGRERRGGIGHRNRLVPNPTSTQTHLRTRLRGQSWCWRVLVLRPRLPRSGWPLNQGTTGPLLLVQMYTAHFRHLDFFPVWSSSDGIGMGTPILLYYHRLFFYIAGLIYLVAGHGLKESRAYLAIFLVVGAYGMRRALGVVTKSKLLLVAGSIGFLFTNYGFTDWLDPRGDLSEFCGLMLVPWLLYWCLNWCRPGGCPIR